MPPLSLVIFNKKTDVTKADGFIIVNYNTGICST